MSEIIPPLNEAEKYWEKKHMKTLMSNFSKWMCHDCNLIIHDHTDTQCNCFVCGKPLTFIEKIIDDYVIDPEATLISC